MVNEFNAVTVVVIVTVVIVTTVILLTYMLLALPATGNNKSPSQLIQQSLPMIIV